ncbi:MAG: hypothetical protein J5674_05885 [Candidatus Methanomethylophilaceae archaeon]|nr:hypothetical protein [Candidatus Methanomethylophilaceae archaeon]
MQDEREGPEAKEEFKINEESLSSGHRFPVVKMIKQEVLFSSCDPDELLERLGIGEKTYSLDKLDEEAVEELSEFVSSNPVHPMASKVETVLGRARCNNGYDIYDPVNVGSLFDSDPACGAIYACNEILDSLAYVMGATELLDNVTYAFCILRAVHEGTISEDEMPYVVGLFSYRDRCATLIDPGVPDRESVEVWKSLLFRLMSMMFGKAAERE